MVGAAVTATSDHLLHLAVTRDDVSIAESLLKHKACVNAQPAGLNGATPLHLAAAAGNEALALVLLKAGDRHAFSALSYVVTHRCRPTTEDEWVMCARLCKWEVEASTQHMGQPRRHERVIGSIIVRVRTALSGLSVRLLCVWKAVLCYWTSETDDS